MKGHMQDGKFHPHTQYQKGTRKSRDQQVKTEGVKIRKQRSEEPELVDEFQLDDILQDVTVDETTDGLIDYGKLENLVRENIEYILKRENVWDSGFKVGIQEVGNARNDTPDEGGYYQFDYQIFQENRSIRKSGTVYGSISAGDVLDMTLELYNERSWS